MTSRELRRDALQKFIRFQSVLFRIISKMASGYKQICNRFHFFQMWKNGFEEELPDQVWYFVLRFLLQKGQSLLCIVSGSNKAVWRCSMHQSPLNAKYIPSMLFFSRCSSSMSCFPRNREESVANPISSVI